MDDIATIITLFLPPSSLTWFLFSQTWTWSLTLALTPSLLEGTRATYATEIVQPLGSLPGSPNAPNYVVSALLMAYLIKNLLFFAQITPRVQFNREEKLRYWTLQITHCEGSIMWNSNAPRNIDRALVIGTRRVQITFVFLASLPLRTSQDGYVEYGPVLERHLRVLLKFPLQVLELQHGPKLRSRLQSLQEGPIDPDLSTLTQSSFICRQRKSSTIIVERLSYILKLQSMTYADLLDLTQYKIYKQSMERSLLLQVRF